MGPGLLPRLDWQVPVDTVPDDHAAAALRVTGGHAISAASAARLGGLLHKPPDTREQVLSESLAGTPSVLQSSCIGDGL